MSTAVAPGVSPFEGIALDRMSPIPLYYQVARHLEQAIESGTLVPGTRFENELELADQLGLSRPTMRRAMQHLVDKGLLVRRRGVGTRVVSPKVRRSLELTSLHDDLIREGQRPSTKLLSLRPLPAPAEIAAALNLRVADPVIEVIRLRSAMDRPIAKMTNFLPAGLLEVGAEALESRGLYELLRAAGIHLHSATQVIGARRAYPAEARLLGESRSAALLTMQRTTYDDRGAVVEYGSHIYAATRYSFQMSLLAG
ncbi:MAG TPA: GntR family transcriptional regulator [Jatrophihabitans sp.]|jgi:DNA-binding GntR family transcriptional regulator|nr:GntR family transcriptional regulator [Jatrophihabitans sp.]